MAVITVGTAMTSEYSDIAVSRMCLILKKKSVRIIPKILGHGVLFCGCSALINQQTVRITCPVTVGLSAELCLALPVCTQILLFFC